MILCLNSLLLTLLPFLNELPSLDDELLLAIDNDYLGKDLDVQYVVLVLNFNRLVKRAGSSCFGSAATSREIDGWNFG